MHLDIPASPIMLASQLRLENIILAGIDVTELYGSMVFKVLLNIPINMAK